MHVVCRCGKGLAVSVDRLPTKIRCDDCGRVFHASEDGGLLEIAEVQPFAVHTLCRCGQPFMFRAEQFPHRLSCHVCGRHFDVFEDGEIVDLDDQTGGKAPSSTAIQPEASRRIGASHSTALAVDGTIERLKETSARATLDVKNQADVKLIDLLWKTERPGYSLIPFAGIQIMPSKQSALYIGLGLFIAWLCAFGPARMTNNGGRFSLALRLGVGPSVFLPIYIYVRAHAYEKAERAWQRKRIVAIAKCESAMTDE